MFLYKQLIFLTSQTNSLLLSQDNRSFNFWVCGSNAFLAAFRFLFDHILRWLRFFVFFWNYHFGQSFLSWGYFLVFLELSYILTKKSFFFSNNRKFSLVTTILLRQCKYLILNLSNFATPIFLLHAYVGHCCTAILQYSRFHYYGSLTNTTVVN